MGGVPEHSKIESYLLEYRIPPEDKKGKEVIVARFIPVMMTVSSANWEIRGAGIPAFFSPALSLFFLEGSVQHFGH